MAMFIKAAVNTKSVELSIGQGRRGAPCICLYLSRRYFHAVPVAYKSTVEFTVGHVSDILMKNLNWAHAESPSNPLWSLTLHLAEVRPII